MSILALTAYHRAHSCSSTSSSSSTSSTRTSTRMSTLSRSTSHQTIASSSTKSISSASQPSQERKQRSLPAKGILDPKVSRKSRFRGETRKQAKPVTQSVSGHVGSEDAGADVDVDVQARLRKQKTKLKKNRRMQSGKAEGWERQEKVNRVGREFWW